MHLPGVSLSASFRSEGAAKHQGVPCLPGECLGVFLGRMQCLVWPAGLSWLGPLGWLGQLRLLRRL